MLNDPTIVRSWKLCETSLAQHQNNTSHPCEWFYTFNQNVAIFYLRFMNCLWKDRLARVNAINKQTIPKVLLTIKTKQKLDLFFLQIVHNKSTLNVHICDTFESLLPLNDLKWACHTHNYWLATTFKIIELCPSKSLIAPTK